MSSRTEARPQLRPDSPSTIEAIASEGSIRRDPSVVAAIEGWVLKHPMVGFGGASLVLVTLVLWAQLRSGYYSDDNVASTIRGAARAHGLGLAGVLVELTRDLFKAQGRFFPVPMVEMSLFYFFDRAGYKASILALTLVDVAVFLWFVKELTRSKLVVGLVAVCVPAFLQTRLGSDPVLCFNGVLQLLVLLTLVSLGLWVRYLERGGRARLALSLVAFGCALLTYEISYAFFLLPMALALTTDKPWAERRGDLWTSGLYVVSVAGAIGMLLVFRRAAGMPWQGVNPAYTPNLDLYAYLLTFMRQNSAAVPLSYTLMGALRPTEIFPLEVALTWFRARAGWEHLVITSGVAALMVAVVPQRREKAVRLLPLALVGGLLWVLPSAVIALSTKYRAENWVSWGNGYLPVYVSIFGGMSLLGCALAWLFGAVAPLARAGAPRVVTAAGLGIVLGGVSSLTATNNDLVVSSLNQSFRDPRDVAEAAMAAGMFEGVPEDAFLLLGSDAFPGANPSFYLAHVPQRLRRVAGPGHYLGEAYRSFGYFGEVYQHSNLRPLPLPERAHRGRVPEGEIYTFGPEDGVWYFKFEAVGPGRGLAVLGRVRGLVATSQQLRLVYADDVRIFRVGDVRVEGEPGVSPSSGPTLIGSTSTITRWSEVPAPGVDLLKLKTQLR